MPECIILAKHHQTSYCIMIKQSLIILFSLLTFSLQLFAQEDEVISSDAKNMSLYKEGMAEFETGNFEKALELLQRARRTNDTQLAANAYYYIAQCHIEMGDMKSAEADVQKMMMKNPYYTVSEAENPVMFNLISKNRKKSATIVTASQQAESIDESPVPVTLITREMIDASGATNLQELLTQYVPGMSKIEGAEPNIAMRGTYSHTQENILIMLDGHRLNSYASNVEAPDYRTSLDKIDHIEVLRGPASSLYGNVALTGVVNIITRRGYEVNGNHASALYGSNNTIGVNFLRGKGGFRTEYLAWASIYSSMGEKVTYSAGEYFGEGHSRINGYRNFPAFDAGTRIRWDDVTLGANIMHSKRTPYENILQYAPYRYAEYGYDHSTKPGTSRVAINLTADYNRSWDKFTLSASLHGNYERSTIYNVIGDTIEAELATTLLNICGLKGLTPETYGIWETLSYQGYSLSANLSNAYSYNIGNQRGSVIGGLQFNFFTLAQGSLSVGYNYDEIQFTTNNAMRDGNENTISAFMQMKHCFSDKFIFNGGLRYDDKRRYNSEHISTLSPRMALIWLMNQHSSIRASYARSFVDAPYLYRACNVDLLHGDLQPQMMTTLQLGLTKNWPEYNLKWELNSFYNICSDLVMLNGKLHIFSGEGSFEGSGLRNSGKEKIGGIESIITYQRPSTLATLNLTYQHAFQYEEDSVAYDYVLNVPDFFANMTFAQRIFKMKKWGNIWFRVNAHFQSAVYNNKYGLIVKMIYADLPQDLNSLNKRQSCKCIANVGAEWTVKKFRLGVDLYNIFNTHYEVSSRTNVPTPQQSRHILAKASFDF